MIKAKITSQGQISVPAAVRRKLGVGPGSVVAFEESGPTFVLKRAGRYTDEDIRKALFPDGPPRRRSLEEMEAGIRAYIRKKHAKR